MFHLAIDIGNTRIKAAFFDKEQLIEKSTFSERASLLSWIKRREVSKAIVCNVGEETELSFRFPTLLFGSEAVKLPISNFYKTPQTLGKDRLAGVIGATAIMPNKNCLVIDAGTCITYDFVTAGGEYLGGAISPGMEMRFKALNHFTARLPLVKAETDKAELIGKTTVQSIRSGVINGIKFEMEKAMEEYAELYKDLKVLLSGGDGHFFESIIKGDIFAFPDLVLLGLNHTLLHNAHS